MLQPLTRKDTKDVFWKLSSSQSLSRQAGLSCWHLPCPLSHLVLEGYLKKPRRLLNGGSDENKIGETILDLWSLSLPPKQGG